MANTTLTSSIITKKALMVLHNMLTFTKGVNTDYSSMFAVDGGKIGATVNIRKPPRYLGRSGQALQIENSTESFVPITLTNQDGCDISFSSADLTLNIDDFSNRFLVPAMATVANKIDNNGTLLYKDINRLVNHGASAANYGTAGALNGGAQTLLGVQGQILTGGAILTENGVPNNIPRAAVIDPISQVSIIQPQMALFNPTSKISGIFQDAAISSNTLGFDWASDANIQQFTPMAAGSLTAISAAPVSGATTVAVTTTAGTVPRGTVFSIAGVYAINPQSRASTGRLMQFVVTADTAVTTTGILPIYPAYIPANGPAPQFATCTGTPGGTAAIVVYSGNVGAGPYSQNLLYTKEAFTLATADLVMPEGVHFAARENYQGISLRIVQAYDINSDMFPCRLDVLYGWKTLYPECAIRHGG